MSAGSGQEESLQSHRFKPILDITSRDGCHKRGKTWRLASSEILKPNTVSVPLCKCSLDFSSGGSH